MNINKAEFVTSYANYKQMPASDRIEIAFSGRSNVGKSSLINKIFNRKNLARVSSMPGKTVTINFYSLEDIYIVDLPGYGYANVSKSEKKKWGDLIGSYLSDGERELALVFQLIDMRHAPSKDDLLMLDFLIDNEIPFVVVFTKADKLKPMQRKQRMESFASEIPCFDDITFVEFSAVTGEGVERIREIISEVAEEGGEFQDHDEVIAAEDTADERINENGSPFGGFLRPNKSLQTDNK